MISIGLIIKGLFVEVDNPVDSGVGKLLKTNELQSLSVKLVRVS